MRVGSRRAHPAPGQQEAAFLALAETLSSLVALIHGETLIHVNPAGCRLLGRPRELLVGRTFWEVLHPDDRARALAQGWAPRSSLPGHERMVERLLHTDGRTIWLEYVMDAVVLDGRSMALLTGWDVTDRQRLDEELRKSEARLAEAQRIAHVGSWEWDVAGDRIVWSDELCRIYGVAPDEFGGTLEGYFELVHPDDRAMAREAMNEALRRGGPYAFEHRVVCGNERARTIFGKGEVFVDASGRPVRVAGTAQDITERKKVEEALKESEERFRNLCTQAPVMLMAFDPGGRVRDVSNCWLQTMGYERGDVVGREGWDFITPDSRERLRKAIEEHKRRKESVIQNLPLRAIRKDGTTVDLLNTSVAQVGDEGEHRGAICVSINLTDLRRAEEALRESEERYRALVEYAPEAIMVLDVEKGHFIDANAHAEKLFGYPRERLLTMGPLDFCPQHQADGRRSCEVADDETRKVLEGGTAVFEFTHVDAAGREIACETRLSRLPAAGRKLIRVTITDVTGLKQLQEKVRHADKMAAVGVLAAGVAHEIGNPLLALSMAAESLERRTRDDYTQKKLALIREHIDRISRIVRQMNDLARPGSRQKAHCDVSQVVRRAVDMVRYDSRSENSEIRYELAEGLPPVEAVEDELTQVCINLALNAFDAMVANPPDRPRRLTIRSEASGPVVRVSFEDTGAGVPREIRSKLFEPFFTTKQVGKGTGLGLAVSYRILEEHQGILRLDEDAVPGARFVFELPRRAHS